MNKIEFDDCKAMRKARINKICKIIICLLVLIMQIIFASVTAPLHYGFFAWKLILFQSAGGMIFGLLCFDMDL